MITAQGIKAAQCEEAGNAEKNGGIKAADNIGLVHSCAHRFKGRGIEYDDLFQAGCMGLVKAINGFDADRGVMFSTYAVPVILGEIRRLFRDGGTVKVSRSIKELGIKAIRLKEEIGTELGRDAAISELAEKLGKNAEDVAEAIAATSPPVSLTESDDTGGQIDLPVDSPEEVMADILSLKQIISGIEEKDRKLIICRYYKNMTQSRTAAQLGMTQVQVSRREKRILDYIRSKMI